jgi:hypothetical protein
MVGKLLSLDLKDRGIIISLVHPGFMRTEMYVCSPPISCWMQYLLCLKDQGCRV